MRRQRGNNVFTFQDIMLRLILQLELSVGSYNHSSYIEGWVCGGDIALLMACRWVDKLSMI